jgi:hypothetical protein
MEIELCRLTRVRYRGGLGLNFSASGQGFEFQLFVVWGRFEKVGPKAFKIRAVVSLYFMTLQTYMP